MNHNNDNISTFLDIVFRCYDLDGDGLISRFELKEWYAAVETWWIASGNDSGASAVALDLFDDDVEHSITFTNGPIGMTFIARIDGNHVHHIEAGSQADNHSDILQPGHRLVRINDIQVERDMTMETATALLSSQKRPVTLTFKPPDHIYDLAYAVDPENVGKKFRYTCFDDWFHDGDKGETKETEADEKNQNKIVHNFRAYLHRMRDVILEDAIREVYRKHQKTDDLNVASLSRWMKGSKVNLLDLLDGGGTITEEDQVRTVLQSISSNNVDETKFVKWVMTSKPTERLEQKFVSCIHKEMQPHVITSVQKILGKVIGEKKKGATKGATKGAKKRTTKKLSSNDEHTARLVESKRVWDEKQKKRKENMNVAAKVPRVASMNTTATRSVSPNKNGKHRNRRKIPEKSSAAAADTSTFQEDKNMKTFLERVFACYDIDGDGHIDRRELKKWYLDIEKWKSRTKDGIDSSSSLSFAPLTNFDLDNLERTMMFAEGVIGIELSHRGDGNHVLSIAPGSQAENHSDILQPGHRLVRINQLSIPRQMSTKHIMETLTAARGRSDIALTFKPPDRIYELARSININDTTIIKFPMFVDWFHNKRKGTKESMLISGLLRGGVTESSIKVISNFRQNLKALQNAVIQLAVQTVYRRHTKSKDSLNARGLLSWIEILRVSSIEGARGTKPTMADAKFLVQKYGSMYVSMKICTYVLMYNCAIVLST